MSKVIRYELCDCGIDHAQYFPGFGVSFTSFAECALGVGENPREALDDALEQIASRGFAIEALERDILASFPDFLDDSANERASVSAHLDAIGEERDDECELYYHVGIRFDVSPNLDDDEEREAFALNARVDDTLYTGEELGALREYAIWKARAVASRLAGNIARALEYENDCERIYAHLGACKW